MSSLEMKNVRHRATPGVQDRLSTEVIILVARKIQIGLVVESAKFLDGDADADLSARPGSHTHSHRLETGSLADATDMFPGPNLLTIMPEVLTDLGWMTHFATQELSHRLNQDQKLNESLAGFR
jgi:hypothetical protein